MGNTARRKEDEREWKQVTDFDEMFPGRFLKAGQFKGKRVTLKIANVYAEKLPDQDSKKRFRGIIAFEKTDQELVLNRTNGECIKAMFGREVASWIGKRVTLFPAPYDGDIAIRVFGSPDIANDINFILALPRKKPFNVLLTRTGVTPAKQPAAPIAAPALPVDPETGEVPFSDEEQAEILAKEAEGVA